jgi:hypothetical protein
MIIINLAIVKGFANYKSETKYSGGRSGLYQRQVAERSGLSEATVYSWESGTGPELAHIPKIIEFLGYVPFERPVGLMGLLRYFSPMNAWGAMGRGSGATTGWDRAR